MNYQCLYNLYFQNREESEIIYSERFKSEGSRRFDFRIGDQQAFLFLHPDHYSMVTEIYRLDKKIQTLSGRLPEAARMQYVKECLISEIQDTNDIEGVVSTRQEIRDILDQLSARRDERLFGMVNRYQFLLQNQNFDLRSPADVRRIYDDLVSEEIRRSDPGDDLDGTLFRTNPVFLYRAGGSVLHEGVKPESEIIASLSRALDILTDDSMDLLIRLCVFHYLFGYIHPFYNGNGRVNRFIASVFLNRTFTSPVSFRLSRQIKEQKKTYYEAFEKTNDPRNRGDLGTFCFYFLEILKALFSSTVAVLTEKADRLGHFQTLLDECKLSGKEKRVLFLLSQVALFSDEGMGMSDLAENSHQSVPWMRKKIAAFSERGWIEKKRKGHEILYAADLSALDHGLVSEISGSD